MDVSLADRRFLVRSFQKAERGVKRQLDGGPPPQLRAGKAIRDHAGSILKLIQALDEQVEGDFESAQSDHERRAILTKLRHLVEVTRVLNHVLAYLQPLQPRAGQLGLGTAYLVHELGRALIDPHVDLIETPLDTPTYATRSWPFERLLHGEKHYLLSPAELRAARGKGWPALMMFPCREATNVFLAPLLVHELGHPAAERNGLVDGLWAKLRSDVPQWPGLLEAYLKASEGSDGAERDRKRNEATLGIRIKLEELLCDALAICCLGPSYLYAFVGHVAATSLAEAMPKHPPTALRIEVMLRGSRRMGWDEVLLKTPRIGEWLDELAGAGVSTLRNESELLHALRVASEAVGEFAVAHARAGDVLFTPERFAAQGALLGDLLKDNILPAQIDHDGTHADRSAVLLAGWIHGLGGKPPTAIPELLADRELHSFLDKALEMSTVLEQWRAPGNGS